MTENREEQGSESSARFVVELLRRIEDAGGRFPDEIEVVQSRLIRSVGRVRGPDGRFVYLKAMTFPRLK
ncbi:MAG: hypothetical protein AAF196_19420, partial [Planctomycetota bacterium]